MSCTDARLLLAVESNRSLHSTSLNPEVGFGRYFRLCGSFSICRGRCSRAGSRERTHTTEMTDDSGDFHTGMMLTEFLDLAIGDGPRWPA